MARNERTRPVRLLAAAAAAAAGCVAYGALVERRWYRTRTVSLPGGLRRPTDRPLRILHLSDLHLAPPDPSLQGYLVGLTRLATDLVVVTGDLLGGEGAEEATAAALGPLTADGTPGVVVLGSNDRFAPTPKNPFVYLLDPQDRSHGAPLETPRLVEALTDHGFTTLADGHTVIDTSLGPVAVGGLDDPHLDDTALPPVEAVAAGDGDAILHLGLVHAPYTAALDVLVAAGHDVLLAGHTHGGQVRLPGIGALVANCDLPLERARGRSRWDGAWLHVSPGLGTGTYAPFRFACRPEATLLEVTS